MHINRVYRGHLAFIMCTHTNIHMYATLPTSQLASININILIKQVITLCEYIYIYTYVQTVSIKWIMMNHVATHVRTLHSKTPKDPFGSANPLMGFSDLPSPRIKRPTGTNGRCDVSGTGGPRQQDTHPRGEELLGCNMAGQKRSTKNRVIWILRRKIKQ